MNNYSKIYWLTRLDSIQALMIVIIILSVVALIIYYICFSTEVLDKDDAEEFNKNYGKIKKAAFYLFIIAGLVVIFLPSKDDMILIYAGGKTMDFVQKDSSINKIPAQTTKIISDYLDKTVKELNKK